jgi:hypothetical protein
MNKILKILDRALVAYVVIGILFGIWLSVEAREFRLDAFVMVVLLWPLIVLFWVAFHI